HRRKSWTRFAAASGLLNRFTHLVRCCVCSTRTGVSGSSSSCSSITRSRRALSGANAARWRRWTAQTIWQCSKRKWTKRPAGSPWWYSSALVRQFSIGTVVVGESVNFRGGIDWLQENGIEVIDLASNECVEMLARFIAENPALWHEEIGEG